MQEFLMIYLFIFNSDKFVNIDIYKRIKFFEIFICIGYLI